MRHFIEIGFRRNRLRYFVVDYLHYCGDQLCQLGPIR